MRISIAKTDDKEEVYFYPMLLDSIEKLAEVMIAQGQSYSPGIFSESYRDRDHWIACDVLVFDVDNKDKDNYLSLDECKEKLRDYIHVIAPTRSHQTDKDNYVDKFRVAIPLTESIIDKDVYTTTWISYSNTLLGKASDPSCKNHSRMYFPSKSIFSINKAGKRVPPARVGFKSAPKTALNTHTSSGKVDRLPLPQKLVDFLFTGKLLNPSGRNESIKDAAVAFKRSFYTKEEALEQLLTTAYKFDIIAQDFTVNELSRTVDSIYSKMLPELSNSKLKADVLNGTIFIDESNSRIKYLVPPDENPRNIDVESLRFILSKDEFKTLRFYVGITGYLYKDISFESPFITTSGGICLNLYRPPKWSTEPILEIPEIYHDYIMHLVNYDEASYHYVIKWTANAIKNRNMTILTAIGIQGAGKGVFAEILSRLVGEWNFCTVRDEIFKNKFNAQLENKRIVLIDEVLLERKDQQNKLKDVVNDKIEIEGKGLKPIMKPNTASYYLCSNDYEALDVTPSDRRISAIEVSQVPLKDTPLIHKFGELFNDENIEKLYRYLWNYYVNPIEMLTPFRSSTFQKILKARLTDWAEWLIESYANEHKGEKMPLEQVQNAIMDKHRIRPSQRKIRDLELKYPKIIKIVRIGSRDGVRFYPDEPEVKEKF